MMSRSARKATARRLRNRTHLVGGGASREPLVPAQITQTCASIFSGENCGCIQEVSVKREPRVQQALGRGVGRSIPNCAEPAALAVLRQLTRDLAGNLTSSPFVCATIHARHRQPRRHRGTDALEERSVSRKIGRSVIETVGRNVETNTR